MSERAALITKHEFLDNFDGHTLSQPGLDELRELFREPKPEVTLRYFRDKRLMSDEVLYLVESVWLREGGPFPDILEKTHAKFREALDYTGRNGRSLSSYIVVGITENYEIEIILARQTVLLLIMVPELPKPLEGRADPYNKLTSDPGFEEYLRAIQRLLNRFGISHDDDDDQGDQDDD